MIYRPELTEAQCDALRFYLHCVGEPPSREMAEELATLRLLNRDVTVGAVRFTINQSGREALNDYERSDLSLVEKFYKEWLRKHRLPMLLPADLISDESISLTYEQRRTIGAILNLARACDYE